MPFIVLPPISAVIAASADMPGPAPGQQRPRLEHRADQTIIDLTEDFDNIENSAFGSQPAVGREPRRILPPPTAELRPRRDPPATVIVDETPEAPVPRIRRANVIDLTAEEPELQFLHARPREGPLPPLPPDHGLFVAQRTPSPDLFVTRDRPVRGRPVRALDLFNGVMFELGMPLDDEIRNHIRNNMAGPMPHALNYLAPAAQGPPLYVQPPAGKGNFTHSPGEDDVAICAGCETELIFRPDQPLVTVTKSTKASSKKDTAEHPWWVVRDCGHVSFPCH